jgi:2,4-dienoyl-CoA reductase-like NADH-dependent reductase (Old Yellow Enzyme family)
MPLQDAISTFSYFIAEADKLGLSYITISRYTPNLDPSDGRVLPCKATTSSTAAGTPHDILSTYARLIHNAKLFVVGGVTPPEAEELVRTGRVDGVFFGTLWVTHPDLAKRIRHGKMLGNMLAVPYLYGDGGVDPKLGYTDYPAVTY